LQVEAKDFLRLVEGGGKLAFVDIEAMGLRGDYNSVLCVSAKPFGGKPKTVCVTTPGKDKDLIAATHDLLSGFDCWATYYGRMFDIPMLNTRALRWELPPLPKRPHLDLYFLLRYNLLTARRSQGHLLSWLKLPEEKMTVSASDWADVAADPKRVLPTMVKRCESDVSGLEGLYRKVRHLVVNINR
jgi:uncharacterized protein YprB with RNaseH-like and TPR domain